MNDDQSAVMDEDDPHARAKAEDDVAEQGRVGTKDEPQPPTTRLRTEPDRQSER